MDNINNITAANDPIYFRPFRISLNKKNFPLITSADHKATKIITIVINLTINRSNIYIYWLTNNFA